MWRLVLLLLAPLAACAGSARSVGSVGATRAGLSCAPFARELTGVNLRGDAGSWWDEADGRYARVTTPEVGGVLVFQAVGRLPSGHVSVVSRVVDERRIEVIQANWSPRTLELDMPVIDVSERGDWSLVRVWWSPINAMGAHPYPTYGFILPPRRLGHDALAGAAENAAARAAGG